MSKNYNDLPRDLKNLIHDYLAPTQSEFNRLIRRYFDKDDEGIVEYVLSNNISDIISKSPEFQIYIQRYGIDDGLEAYIENNPDYLIVMFGQLYKSLSLNKKIKLARAIVFEMDHPIGFGPSRHTNYKNNTKIIKDILEYSGIGRGKSLW